MSWLQKKLWLKLALIEAVLVLVGMGLWKAMPDYGWVAIVGMGVFSLVAFSLVVTRPFGKILREFKALITGKQYRRIYTKKRDEIGIVAHFFNEITRSLERVSSDIKEHRRLSSELNVARKIQQDLIPKTAPDIPGLDIIAKTKPAAEIGGDSFDFITKGDQTYMYIGDVTGHGVPSGLVMMIVDTLIHTFTDSVQNSHQLLTLTNKYLKPRIQTTMFMTMMMLRWEHNTKKMHYTGAGHETLFHYKATEGVCENIRGGGIALGMVPDNEKLIKETSLEIKENDFLVLYTDGIVEAKNENGEMYSIEKFKELVEKEASKSKTAEELFTRLSSEVLQFLGDFVQEDDMTLLVVRRGDEPQRSPEEKQTEESTQWETESNPSVASAAIGQNGEVIEESGLKTP